MEAHEEDEDEDSIIEDTGLFSFNARKRLCGEAREVGGSILLPNLR
jgi:hypothetical protein